MSQSPPSKRTTMTSRCGPACPLPPKAQKHGHTHPAYVPDAPMRTWKHKFPGPLPESYTVWEWEAQLQHRQLPALPENAPLLNQLLEEDVEETLRPYSTGRTAKMTGKMKIGRALAVDRSNEYGLTDRLAASRSMRTHGPVLDSPPVVHGGVKLPATSNHSSAVASSFSKAGRVLRKMAVSSLTKAGRCFRQAPSPPQEIELTQKDFSHSGGYCVGLENRHNRHTSEDLRRQAPTAAESYEPSIATLEFLRPAAGKQPKYRQRSVTVTSCKAEIDHTGRSRTVSSATRSTAKTCSTGRCSLRREAMTLAQLRAELIARRRSSETTKTAAVDVQTRLVRLEEACQRLQATTKGENLNKKDVGCSDELREKWAAVVDRRLTFQEFLKLLTEAEKAVEREEERVRLDCTVKVSEIMGQNQDKPRAPSIASVLPVKGRVNRSLSSPAGVGREKRW